MKQTLTTGQAADILASDTNSSFSYSGAYALCEYLEELEADCGEEIEFCHVAIRCDYSEYKSLQEWAVDYFDENWREDVGISEDDEGESEIEEEKIREYIQDHGILIEFDGGIIVSSF